MGTAVDPLRTLARLALDEAHHRRVHARREGDQVHVEEREGDRVGLRWAGSVVEWNRALHRAAGLRTPSSPGANPDSEQL